MNEQAAKKLCISAHAGQFRRQTYLPQGPGKLITDNQMADLILRPSNGHFVSLPDSSKVTYCSGTKTWSHSLPYHTHPIQVSAMMTTEHEQILGYLHDVIEDTDYYLETSVATGKKYICSKDGKGTNISYDTYTDLNLLTHTKHQPYSEYIQAIANSGRLPVIKCKLADIITNLSGQPSTYAKEKYLAAMPILLGAINE